MLSDIESVRLDKADILVDWITLRLVVMGAPVVKAEQNSPIHSPPTSINAAVIPLASFCHLPPGCWIYSLLISWHGMMSPAIFPRESFS